MEDTSQSPELESHHLIQFSFLLSNTSDFDFLGGKGLTFLLELQSAYFKPHQQNAAYIEKRNVIRIFNNLKYLVQKIKKVREELSINIG